MEIKAKWLIDPNGPILENASLTLDDQRVVEYGRVRPNRAYKDLGPGAITFRPINCHTHLWLSGLKERLDLSEGFLGWTRNAIVCAQEFTEDQGHRGLMAGIAQSKSYGTYAILDLEPLWLGNGVFQVKGPYIFRFLEVLGRLEGEVLQRLPLLSFHGLCIHGPHTVPPVTMKALGLLAKGSMLTAHVAESDLELEFLLTGKGPWRELMEERGHDISLWAPFGKGPFLRLKEAGILGPNTILVHCIHADEMDMRLIKETGTMVCICPRSSLYLHGQLPPLREFLRHGIVPCLGTDSLASVQDLSMWGEMKCLLEQEGYLGAQLVFQMATLVGARALKIKGLEGILGPVERLMYIDQELDPHDPYASLIYAAAEDKLGDLGGVDGI